MPKLTSDGTLDYSLPGFDPTDPMFNELMGGSSGGASTKSVSTDPAGFGGGVLLPGQSGAASSADVEHMPVAVPGGPSTPGQMPDTTGFPVMDPAKGAAPPPPNKSGSFSDYLLGILGNTAPGSSNFQSLLDSANQGYGFGANQDGSALWDPSRQIIEMQGGYGTFENGAWKFTPRGPEGPSATDASGGNDTLTSMLTSLFGQDQQSRQQIQDFIRQYSQPVSATDPTIQGPSDAYEGKVNRGLNDYQEKLAERAYAEGVPSGAFDSALSNAHSQAGQAKGGYTADLMNNENVSRRNAVLGALGIGSGATSQDLSMLLTNQGQKLQNQQFYDQFSSNLADGLTSQDKLLMELLLGGGGTSVA